MMMDGLNGRAKAPERGVENHPRARVAELSLYFRCINSGRCLDATMGFNA
jgi:hypothetical protein